VVEKYADDIIAYVIGKQAGADLPQNIAEAVERWCSVNRIRLNASKCKVMHTPSKSFEPPIIKLADVSLQSVKEYKYLGFYLNDTFDSRIQWDRIQPKISQNIALLKQLQCSGLKEEILVSVFKSLVLSHLRYSSTILVACPDGTKSDMQVLQNTLLRTIGITRDLAKSKYGILDVSELVSKTSLEQVICILTTDGKEPSDHRLSASFRDHRPYRIFRSASRCANRSSTETESYGPSTRQSVRHRPSYLVAAPAPTASSSTSASYRERRTLHKPFMSAAHQAMDAPR
jgi:hypothetical protein